MMELRYQKWQFYKRTKKETLGAKGTLVPTKKTHIQGQGNCSWSGESKNSLTVL